MTEGDIQMAVEALRAGQPVGMPTETVYGLAADATSEAAVRRIFDIKGRPTSNPLIVHVSSAHTTGSWTSTTPEPAAQLMEAFWPGPLTLVLPHSGRAAPAVVAGLSTIALRCPDHPVALELLEVFGGGLAAPSANRSGSVSPTAAAAVRAELGDEVQVVLDGGRCEIGIESTIVDCTAEPVRILRPGTITAEDIAAVLGTSVEPASAGAGPHPGSLPRHYAPGTPLTTAAPEELATTVARLLATGEQVVALTTNPGSLQEHPALRRIEMPAQLPAFARDLYARLREADNAGASHIACELPPRSGIGAALRDRLGRAAHS